MKRRHKQPLFQRFLLCSFITVAFVFSVHFLTGSEGHIFTVNLDALVDRDQLCKTDYRRCNDILEPFLEERIIKVEGVIIDSFLASHSTWGVIEDPDVSDNSFVISEVVSRESSPIIYHLRHALDLLQFPLDCDNLWIDRFYTTGFGFTESALEYGLSLGLASKKTFVPVVKKREKWPYLVDCNDPDPWSCFFLRTTNCTSKQNPTTIFPSIPDQLQTISHYVIPDQYAEMIGARKNSQGEMSTEDLLWWRRQLLSYLMRPNFKTRMAVKKLIEDKLNLPQYQQFLTGPKSCMVMHIRHGDIWMEPTRRKYYNLTQYMVKAIPMLQQVNSKIILLATDDKNIIEETKKYPNYEFISLPRERRAGKAPQYHMFEGRGDEEVYWILTLFKMAANCNSFLGVFSSNFSNLLYKVMCEANGGVCPAAASMDDPDWHILF